MMFRQVIFCLVFALCFYYNQCINSRVGPDPWDHIKDKTSSESTNDGNIPPDLRMPLKKKIQTNGNLANGEWFFKRTLAIILNAGQIKINEDGKIDVSLQMHFDQDRWQVLKDYTKSNNVFTEEMFRRAIAYVEEAIYKPSMTQEIIMAWSEYIQAFFQEYKTYITWCCGSMAAFGSLFWLWKHISHKHVIILIIAILYLYEVIISYKEAEKQELDRFVAAVNKCSWYFWISTCEIPPPDPLIFMKHMNPLKIGIRLFTTFLSEPMLVLSTTVNTMIHDITDQLWFPFDVILHSILIICINVMLIVLLVMIFFNYVLNIPFNLNPLGLMKIELKQRKQTLNANVSSNAQTVDPSPTDRISGATLEKILDVCSRALDNSQNVLRIAPITVASPIPKIKRSASTGRLPSSSLEEYNSPETTTRKRNKPLFMIGGGDSRNQQHK